MAGFTTLIDADILFKHIADTSWRIIDCRFSLDNPDRGYQDYLTGHIPGALYAHLNDDLSSPVIPDKTGRHPLPDIPTLIEKFSSWGINHHTQVVAYDDNTGAFAGRLWWLLRWLGHEKVAVLNGGWANWVKHYPTDKLIPVYAPSAFTAKLHPEKTVDAEFVLSAIQNHTHLLLDARAPERYRGEQEPIDKVAGHIPTAICAPFSENLTPDGLFKSPPQLAKRFQQWTHKNKSVICYCGSGVTTTHNILAMVHAGLLEPQLYAGSWSEWITDPSRPVHKGGH
jgi:thiosulfate/3-mercaptopyruvate sulfurtransferase